MKPYPEYKASGIDWLGEIPSHWNTLPTQYIFDIYSGSTPNSNDNRLWDGDIVWITPADFNTVDRNIARGKRNITQQGLDSCSTVLLPKRSIIFSKRAPIGKVVISDTELCTNQGCLGCVAKSNVSIDYYYYLMSILEPEYNILGSGSTFMELSAKEFSIFKLLVPPKEEQEAIAGYLDEVTGKIDALISEKTAQVEELRAYRSSLITETVSLGLNPDAPLRDSGIDWLGSIPQHWEISKSAWTFDTIGSGITPSSGADEYYDNGTINWLQTGDLNDGIITSTSKKITQLAVNDKGLRIYPKGSLVIAMYGATIAKTGILDIDTTVNQACCVLLPSNKIINKFAFYYFKAAKNALISLASGGGQPNISQAIIANFKTILPPLSEQQEIADFLDEKTAKIDSLIEELTKQLDELAEYKQAVITEAVTGKVDVRDYKPRN